MKDKQKQLLTEVMNADANDGLYDHLPDVGKKVTAVEWLIKELANSGLLITKDIDNLVAYRKAKQMEKEQIINFFLFFRNNGEKYLGMTIEQFVEQYYNETYKNK